LFAQVMSSQNGGQMLVHELLQMRSQGSCATVNCSRSEDWWASRFGRHSIAAKHAVLGLTKSAALKYVSAGIHIQAVCPGIITTPMVAGMLVGEEAGSTSAPGPTRTAATLDVSSALEVLVDVLRDRCRSQVSDLERGTLSQRDGRIRGNGGRAVRRWRAQGRSIGLRTSR
jgi:NAD(P)-dependent dehydrogenase (short-subunit alcohol dehydrogenase family)